MYLELSEQEAHVLILKGLGMQEDALLKKRGDLHILQSPHTIFIKAYGEEGSIFKKTEESLPEPPPFMRQEIPDDCFVVDGVNDDIAEMEEHLDGT